MATDCPLCDSRSRAAANSMRALGANTSEIASACGCEEDTVRNHFDHCLATRDEPPDSLGGTDVELRVLLRDAEENFHTSVLQGNSAAASASLNVRLRILSELGERERLRARQKADAEDCDPARPSSWTTERATWVVRYLDEILRIYRTKQTKTEVTQ